MSPSAATAPTTRYRARQAIPGGPDGVLWKEVDEGWVRFDPVAGQTLLLTPIARFVLDELVASGRAQDIDALIAAVLREEPEATAAEAHVLVGAALEALTAARLIQPAPLENP